jgi:hypothetical protein
LIELDFMTDSLQKFGAKPGHGAAFRRTFRELKKLPCVFDTRGEAIGCRGTRIFLQTPGGSGVCALAAYAAYAALTAWIS